MSTKHKLRAWLPVNDGDDEISVEIAFTWLPGAKATRDDPGWGAEVDFIAAASLPADAAAAFGLTQAALDNIARDWLESDEGYAEALAEVAAELDDARAFIAEIRRESP